MTTMTQSISRVKAMLSAGRVQRLHIHSTIKEYSVAAHTLNMLSIADYIYEGVTPSTISRAILYHDMHEVYMGDIPYHTKRKPELKDGFCKVEEDINTIMHWPTPSSKADQDIVDIVDILEFMSFVLHERRLGNSTLDGVFENSIKIVHDSPLSTDSRIAALFDDMCGEYYALG